MIRQRHFIRVSLVVASVVALAVSSVGCGGGAAEPETPASKSAAASPIDELKGIPSELEAEMSAVTKPIDDIQSVIDEVLAIPKKHKLNAAEVMGMAKASLDGGKVEIKVEVAGEVREELEAALKKLSAAVASLKDTPNKVTALTKKVAEMTARVPALAGKVTASATATVSNPFAAADAKAKAQADLDGVKTVQADVMKSVSDMQAKLAGIPQMATGALAKLTAAFTVGG